MHFYNSFHSIKTIFSDLSPKNFSTFFPKNTYYPILQLFQKQSLFVNICYTIKTEELKC